MIQCLRVENRKLFVCFQKLCFKKFVTFASPLLTVAMAALIHDATNNHEGKTFT
jgi:hypothetical protein